MARLGARLAKLLEEVVETTACSDSSAPCSIDVPAAVAVGPSEDVALFSLPAARKPGQCGYCACWKAFFLLILLVLRQKERISVC